MDRWNAHVDPASGTTYDVTERSGVTLPKEGSANGTPSSGASPLKIALGVVAAVVLACILPADSALRGAIPLSFPVLSPGGVRSDHAVDARRSWWALPLILEEAVAVARGRLLDHKGRRATFGFVLHELEESQRRLLLRRREVERVVASRRRLDAKRQREVERMDRTINGTALEAPCWGFDVRGRRSCLSYDEALAADAAFPPSDVGSVAFVVAWCGDRFDWVSDLMARSRGAPQVWKRLIVYQKCAIYQNASDGGFIVAYRHDRYATTKPQKMDCTVTGPDTTLTSIDVRRSIMNSATVRGQVVPRVDQALRALDIRVVPLIEPGRGYPTGPRQMRPPYSTDEVGAYLPVRKSTSATGALSHFPAMTRPSWLRRAVRNRYRHAIE